MKGSISIYLTVGVVAATMDGVGRGGTAKAYKKRKLMKKRNTKYQKSARSHPGGR